MPASYQPWVEPVQGEHPRIYFSNRKKLPVGDIDGTFTLGETIVGLTSGATGLAREGLDAGQLHYLPLAGTFQVGETVEGQTSGATTTVTGPAKDETISLATIRARANGALSSYWSACKSEAANRSNAAAFPNSWFETREFEYAANMAFVYAVDPTLTGPADRAIAVAQHIAGKGSTAASQARDWVRLMAYVYDWCYSRMSSAVRSAVRGAIAARVEELYPVNPAEYYWGTSHGDTVGALTALGGILSDGSASENTTRRNRMDYMLDQHLKGGTNATFLAGYRYYGDTDGGTNKGSGGFGYARAQQNFYYRCFPALRSSILVDWDVTESWWNKMLLWFLAMWRQDRSFFKKGENQGLDPYALDTMAHAVQVASRENNAYGEHCMWLEQEAEDLGEGILFGPFKLYQVIFRDPGRPAIRPTVERYGGKHMHLFRSSGHVVFRNGWTADSVAVSWDLEPDFSGGHTKRRAGNIQVAGFGSPLLRDCGSYDANQSNGYKVVGDAGETGHRWAYTKRIASAGRMWRIFDTDELDENLVSFGKWRNSNQGRFGVLNGSTFTYSNDGGQLWPKGAGNKYQPDSLADLEATPAWRRATFALDPPVEDTGTPSKYCYGVADLEPCYYSSKCTKFLQHVLYIKPNVIPGWSYPAVLIFEELNAHIDSVKGERTCVLMMNSQNEPAGPAASLVFDVGSARMFHRTLKPSSLQLVFTSGPVIEGVTFDATNQKSFDDEALARTELNVASSLANQEWVTLLFPCPSSVAAPPSLTLIDDGTWIGATIGGIDCKVKKSSPYQASVGASTDTTPPAAPSGLAGTPGSVFADLNWNDNSEGDLAGYDVFRADPL